MEPIFSKPLFDPKILEKIRLKPIFPKPPLLDPNIFFPNRPRIVYKPDLKLLRALNPYKLLNPQRLTFCTYDLGVDINENVDETLATELIKIVSAFCLQEVRDEDRPFIQELNDENFEICHSEFEDGTFDTAVALDKSRFSQIQNHSTVIEIDEETTKDAAIATAIDNITGEKVVIVSLNAPAFDLTAGLTQQEKANITTYFEKVAAKINKLAPSKIQIIGANMNNNPETYQAPFNFLANRKFDLHRTNAARNDQVEETDFLFTKAVTTLWEKIKSIFCKTITYQGAIRQYPIREEYADHFPVFADIDPVVEKAKIVKLWKAVCRACKSIFKIN